MLLSELGRPQGTFDGKDLYPDLFLKTAALMDSLVRNHPFVDGNKWSAITSAALFLRMNGYRLIKVKPEWIDAEIRQMIDVRYAATKSRSMLGTMNDYKFQIETLMAESLDVSGIEIALHLSVCPVGPLQYRSPDQVTLDLLKTSYGAG